MSVVPNDKDVLLGRGYAIMAHPGNQTLLTIVRAQKSNFLATKRRADKRAIANAIVDEITRRGGRFLMEKAEKDHPSGALSIEEKTWVGVEREKAAEKVMIRLRERDKGEVYYASLDGLEGLGRGQGTEQASVGGPAPNALAGMAPDAQNMLMMQMVHNNLNANVAGSGNNNVMNGLGAQQLQQQQEALICNGFANGSNSQALDANQLQQLMGNQPLCNGLNQQLPPVAKLQQHSAQIMGSGDTSDLGGAGTQSNTAGHIMNDSTGMYQQQQTMGNGFNQQLPLDANQLQSGIWMPSADVSQSNRAMNNLTQQQPSQLQQSGMIQMGSADVAPSKNALHSMNDSMGMQQQQPVGDQSFGNGLNQELPLDANQLQQLQTLNGTGMPPPPQSAGGNMLDATGHGNGQAMDGSSDRGLQKQQQAGGSALLDASGLDTNGLGNGADDLDIWFEPLPFQVAAERSRNNFLLDSATASAKKSGGMGMQQSMGSASRQSPHSPAVQSQSSQSPAIQGQPSQSPAVQSQASQSPAQSSNGAPSPLYSLNTGKVHGTVGSIPSSGFGAAPIGIGEWMQTAGGVSSKNAYIVGAVELGWAIAKHLSDSMGSGQSVNLGDLSSEDVLIFMESSDPASYAVRPAIREVQIQVGGLGGGAHRNRAGSPREACASLGQILLEIFSMNQSSSMDISSQRTQENDETQQVQKRMATTESKRSSISSKANNLLLGLVMPASINRLVCDLLDAADEACPSTALTTLEGALDDLTQMRNDPASFLFDRTSPEEALRHFHSPDERLFGREKELTALMKAKDNVSTSVLGDGRTLVGQGSDFVCEAAFVGGYAGSGKSSLLLPLVPACNEEQWFVLSCKFDKQAAPVKVLYSALDDFFGKWGEGSDSSFNPALMGSFREVCECICSTIDDDGFQQLSELVPNFTKRYPQLVKRTGTPDQVVVSSMDKVGSAKTRLQNLIHVLFKSLCSAGRPVLLVMDDIQWCDSFVLEGLTEFIVSYMHSEAGAFNNRRRRGLMLAGTYRSNEVADGHPFIESINCLENSQNANITMLTAGELSETDVTRLISTKLCLPRRYTRELAGVVHIKTRGNPFFINQFLRSIVSNKMLEFSVKSRRWVWDCDVVEMQMISDGVAELLTASFNRLPEALMEAMKRVSCLGYQVERSTIDALDANREVVPFSILDWMERAVKEGILEKAGPMYQFTHDIIQQTIYELIPPGDRNVLHKLIGQSLLKSARRRPTMHLLAVDQINMFCKDSEGIVLSPEERSQFAHSNAQAAKYAISSSSFEQARAYVDVGIRLLEPNHWETQYALSLNLYEMSASVSCIIGDVSNLSTCLDAVLSHSKSFEDSLKASSMLAKLLASNSQYDDARSNCLSILKQLGEGFPSEVSLPLVQQELPAMRTFLRNIAYDRIKHLAPMTEWKKINSMKFLNMLGLYCAVSKPLLLPRLSCQMLKLTLEHGFCEDSIVGIATAGYSVFLYTDDIELAADLCRVSESLIQKSSKKHVLRARLCIELYTTLKLLREPWPSVVTLLPELYNSAMLAGDIENALICRWNQSATPYWVGALSLSTVSEQLLLCIKEADKYQQNTVLFIAMAIVQSCMHLSGTSINADIEIKSFDELNDIGMRTHSNILLWNLFMLRMSNLFWGREFWAVAELSDKCSETFHSALQEKRALHVIRVFYEGIVYLNLARRPGDATKEWREMGEKAVAAMTGYATSMSKWNFENKALLLQAELHYLNGDIESADTAYEGSIRSAHAHKFVHEEALAYELHGIFCVESSMAGKGTVQLRMALAKYKEWGAAKKAKKLQLFIDSVDDTDPLRLETLALR